MNTAQRFYSISFNPLLTDVWFPDVPLLAGNTVIDPRLLTNDRVKVWHEIWEGKEVEVQLVPMDGLRYSLSVHRDGICAIDAREFTEGRRYIGPMPATVHLRQEGSSPAFTFGGFDLPVVSDRVVTALSALCPNDIQCLPVSVGLFATGFQILNVIATADCLDEARSSFEKWTPSHNRPDRVGDYRLVVALKVDPNRTQNRHMFRIRGWHIALVVSEEVKNTLEAIDNLGVVFEEVS